MWTCASTKPGTTHLPGRVDDLAALVVAEAGDPAVDDRDIRLEPLAREDRKHLARRERRGRQARRHARRRAASKGLRPWCENRTLRPVDVLTPTTLDEALRLKADHPGAMPIQGGTDLMVALNFDRDRPAEVLNLNEVRELRGYRARERRASARFRPHVRGDRARRAARRRCLRSPRRRAPSDRRRSATAARSAATSAPPLLRVTRSRRSSSRARRSSARRCAARAAFRCRSSSPA